MTTINSEIIDQPATTITTKRFLAKQFITTTYFIICTTHQVHYMTHHLPYSVSLAIVRIAFIASTLSSAEPNCITRCKAARRFVVFCDALMILLDSATPN